MNGRCQCAGASVPVVYQFRRYNCKERVKSRAGRHLHLNRHSNGAPLRGRLQMRYPLRLHQCSNYHNFYNRSVHRNLRELIPSQVRIAQRILQRMGLSLMMLSAWRRSSHRVNAFASFSSLAFRPIVSRNHFHIEPCIGIHYNARILSSSALYQESLEDDAFHDDFDGTIQTNTTELFALPVKPRKTRSRASHVASAASDTSTALLETVKSELPVVLKVARKPKASTPPYYGTSTAPKKTKAVAIALHSVDSGSEAVATTSTTKVATTKSKPRAKKTRSPSEPTINDTIIETDSPQKKTRKRKIVAIPVSTPEISTALEERLILVKSKDSGELLHPLELFKPDKETGLSRLPYPKALSPSSIKEFQACPQSFFFQYILGLKQPTTPVLAKGSMCHAALERVFDLDPAQRSLPVLQNLFRTAWSEHRLTDIYRSLFEFKDESDDVGSNSTVSAEIDAQAVGDSENQENQEPTQMQRRRDLEREAAWGREGLQLLENYWKVENAAQVLRPNPVQREMWVRALLSTEQNTTVTDVPAAATTPATVSNETLDPLDLLTNETTEPNKFLVRGIIDRLDMVQDATNRSSVSLRLIDYKSGKAPDLKYSAPMNAKIQREAFEQLLIYALLHRETGLRKDNPMPLRYLRLFYLTSVVPDQAVYWDLDLGATPEERNAVLNPVYQSIVAVWTAICKLIDEQDPTLFTGCERSFCYCHTCRSRFVPGSVWEPPPR
jgi:RecB family exonuclease